MAGDVQVGLDTVTVTQPRQGSVDEFGGFLETEHRRWKEIVERSGVRVD